MKEMMKETEAAEFLSIAPVTLRIWRTKHCGPAFIKIGRAVRYRRIDLESFLQENLVVGEQQILKEG